MEKYFQFTLGGIIGAIPLIAWLIFFGWGYCPLAK
tara:strand:- start:7699 stop:7803 length:105 start_codon:yes stop_codon:yes gene_type:complete